jgi:hypothetical protein
MVGRWQPVSEEVSESEKKRKEQNQRLRREIEESPFFLKNS